MAQRLVATGSALAKIVSNDELLAAIAIPKPGGGQITADWVDRYLGIRRRSLDVTLPAFEKPSPAEGGLFDGDFAVAAAHAALAEAELEGSAIGALVHVSCTPDRLRCGDHLRAIAQRLRLKQTTRLFHLDLGCAGLAAGFDLAALLAESHDAPEYVLVVASNCASAYATRELLERAVVHPHPWAWLNYVLFGDAGAAAVFRSEPPRTERHGILASSYETHPDLDIVTYPAGGSLEPPTARSLGDHVYLVDGANVRDAFGPLLRDAYARLRRDWPGRIAPLLGGLHFSQDAIARWYIHQANARLARDFLQAEGLPESKCPIAVERIGNTSAPGTLVMLDEDRRSGATSPGDLLVFLWVGAGAGAMSGYAVVRA